MKKLLVLLALAAASCQSQSGAPAKTAAPAARPAVPVPAATSATEFLRRHNLADLLLNSIGRFGNRQVQPLNGFLGADHYRLEVLLTQAHPDTARPGYYQVQGLDRYRGRIRPLTGWVRFTQVRPTTGTEITPSVILNPPPLIRAELAALHCYAALGTYELREAATPPGAGVFRGRVAVDMRLDDQGHPLPQSLSDSLSEGGMTTFTGTWTSLATGQQKPAAWVASLFTYRGLQVAGDFFIGGRDPAINPRYARRGWHTYWENDEWWSASPGAQARR